MKIPAFSPVRKDENSSENTQQSYCHFFFFFQTGSYLIIVISHPILRLQRALSPAENF